MRLMRWFMFGAGAVVCCAAAFGAADTLTYQGTVTDAAGQPSSGTYPMRFEMFPAATGGSAVYSETHGGVTAVNGVFATELGAITPFGSLFDDHSDLYLEVTIDIDGDGFDPEEVYAPRLPVTAAPYALSGSGGTFTAGDAVAAMGAKDNANPLHHDRYTDGEAIAAVDLPSHAADAAAHHTRYTDGEAISAVGLPSHAADVSAHHTRYTDGEAVSAMGVKDDANALHHDRFTDAEVSANADVAANTALRHAPYTDGDAVNAMGTKDDANPLNHDKFALSTDDVQTTHIQDGAVTASKLGSDLQVAFSASRSVGFVGSAFPLVFDNEHLDTASAYDTTTGGFTAPSEGVYFFSITLRRDVSAFIGIRVNGTQITQSKLNEADSNTGISHSETAILELQGGDVVDVVLTTSGQVRGDSTLRITRFQGYKLF